MRPRSGLKAPAFWASRGRRPKTEAKRLIDRLAAPLDDMLQVLVQEAAAGVAIIDRHGLIVRVNDALRRMVSRECDVSPGQPVQALFCQDHQPEVMKELALALAGQRPPCRFVSMLPGQGLGRHTVEINAVALREADESVSGAILQLNDITAQTQLEAQLLQSQKLQAVGQLAGGIAHDFNNLLTTVMGAAEDALARAGSDREMREDLEHICASAERGAALVRHLLAFGRQQTLQPRAIGINAAVNSVTTLLRRLLGSTIRLDLELEPTDRCVCVDPTQLDQVLINLAVNARDAMAGGGRLTLRTGHVTLYRALTRAEEVIPPGRYVMVEVQDTGVGIPADILPRIFDPFFTTRREKGGSGLGLSTVHGIVRQSDGFVAVDSLVGEGTRIRLYLPRSDADGVDIPQAPLVGAVPVLSSPETSREHEPGTVLLVDDEDIVRRLAVRALSRANWTVIEAASGEIALGLLARRPGIRLDAIVSDVVMPGMDGPTLVRAVRERYPALPAILASGYTQDAVRGNLSDEDIIFMPKPYTLKALVAAVGNLVERPVGRGVAVHPAPEAERRRGSKGGVGLAIGD